MVHLRTRQEVNQMTSGLVTSKGTSQGTTTEQPREGHDKALPQRGRGAKVAKEVVQENPCSLGDHH